MFPGSHGTCRAEQDLWGRAGQVVGGAAFGKDVAGEPELVDGGLVDLLAVGGRLGAQDARVGGLEADDAQEFGDVDVLGVRPQRRTLSELAMISTPRPLR